ncbi:hypothetical protein DIURU_002181 [Diutina rugosa]|uniref:Major facilitator superfamily (MFS) profile domain-containing protein n=1 Tax=Diutina rugosa TaxID=5481 RepID=A0A642UQM1_DIURU|nr:uncharacterized protein DIURU_002181 [Diutina rugosa]KAA8903670.1 hypothetical protein DIURU_002181 [Diutina rugosa]
MASLERSSTKSIPPAALLHISPLSSTPSSPDPLASPKSLFPSSPSALGPPKNDLPPPSRPSSPPPYSVIDGYQRVVIIILVCAAGFLGPVAGNIYVPLLARFQTVFNASAVAINGTVSAFMGVFAIAPIVWGVFADRYGRKPSYFLSLGIFVLASILLASLPPKLATLYVLRVFQSIGASAVMSIGAATMADIIEPRLRGTYIAYFMLGPQSGPILGPILSLVASNGNWRWVFGILAIAGGIIYISIIVWLPETNRSIVGNGYGIRIKLLNRIELFHPASFTDRPPQPPKQFLRAITYPPVLICALISGLLFASFYGVMVKTAFVLRDVYGFNTLQVSLSYLCPGASLMIGSISSGRISDRIQAKKGQEHLHEKRLILTVPGLVLQMCAVISWGWLVHLRVHVATVIMFLFFVGFGTTWVLTICTAYLTQCAGGRPATKVALANAFRNAGAAIAAAVIEPLVRIMGLSWCFTGLGLTGLISLAMIAALAKWRKTWKEKFELAERRAQISMKT